MLLKPSTTAFDCPLCGAKCELRALNPFAPRVVRWFCTENEQHSFMPGLEAAYAAVKKAEK